MFASFRADLVKRSLFEAVATMLAILATFALVFALDPEPGSLILAVVLTMSLSRSQLDRDWRGRLEAAAVLPLVALVSLGVGTLLLRLPAAGAVLFIAGIAASIWLRRFGAAAQRAGSLIALPFVVLLVTPYIPSQRFSGLPALLMPMIVALIALVSVSLTHWLGRQMNVLPPLAARAKTITATPTPRESAMRPLASTRMAIQMAVALTAAFVVGFAFFRGHWSWVVLTAFIVNSGNRGRGDVAYKSILRVLGAAAGTLAALLLATHLGAHDAATVGFMLLAVFFGLWLRPLGYAWWALFVTLALAMLQNFIGTSAQIVLWPRLEEIAIGAILGVGAAWFVLPIPSTAVLRRRIADALAALSIVLDPATASPTSLEFISAVSRVEEIAPAFRAWRLLSRRWIALQPADWVDALTAIAAATASMIESCTVIPGLRAELGKTRRALREPAEILPALHALQRVLDRA